MSCDKCDYAEFCDERVDVWTYIGAFLGGIGFTALCIAVTIFLGRMI